MFYTFAPKEVEEELLITGFSLALGREILYIDIRDGMVDAMLCQQMIVFALKRYIHGYSFDEMIEANVTDSVWLPI